MLTENEAAAWQRYREAVALYHARPCPIAAERCIARFRQFVAVYSPDGASEAVTLLRSRLGCAA